jgi:hypothetical protein
MDLNRHDPHLATVPAQTPAALCDPDLIEAVRSALTALVKEQSARDAAPKEEKKEEKKEKKPEEQMPIFWKLCSAALVSVTALIAVTLYNQLNTHSSQLRSDLGQLRNEITQLRNDLVPKDDYSARNERVVNSIKAVQASHKGALDTWRESSLAQRSTESDLRLQIRELERELQRMRERLSALEQRELALPDTSPKGKRVSP